MTIKDTDTSLLYLGGGCMLSRHSLRVSLGTVCILVKVLHEPEEGELIKEDLRDLNQQILTTVLQRAAHELTQGLLRARTHTGHRVKVS